MFVPLVFFLAEKYLTEMCETLLIPSQQIVFLSDATSTFVRFLQQQYKYREGRGGPLAGEAETGCVRGNAV